MPNSPLNEDKPASAKDSASQTRAKDPLHGVKLEQILTELVARYQWQGLADRLDLNCFKSDPSIKSSLKFLRKTPWAREKVERLYLTMNGQSARKRATKKPAAIAAGSREISEKRPTLSRSGGGARSEAGKTTGHKKAGFSKPADPWANAKVPGADKG